MKELKVWENIPKYEGMYEASIWGEIASIDRYVKHPIKKQQHVKGIILKKAIDNNGYYVVSLSKNGIAKTRTVHQLIAETYHNHKPKGRAMVVNHINFNKLDNRVSNLEIITNRENSNQKHIKSTSEYVGVYLMKKSNKWRALICINGKQKHLGCFINELDASNAYQTALSKLGSK